VRQARFQLFKNDFPAIITLTKVTLPIDGPGQAGDDASASQNAARSIVIAQQPRASQAGVEISNEMIQAGAAVYLGFCPDSGVGDAVDRKMVAEIFLAMLEARVSTSEFRSG
jgi:hypothetical protein